MFELWLCWRHVRVVSKKVCRHSSASMVLFSNCFVLYFATNWISKSIEIDLYYVKTASCSRICFGGKNFAAFSRNRNWTKPPFSNRKSTTVFRLYKVRQHGNASWMQNDKNDNGLVIQNVMLDEALCKTYRISLPNTIWIAFYVIQILYPRVIITIHV